uniref:IS21 family transposase n=1 Tax=Anisakis simplex TaxID=6269 RepID=A0A0M3JEQ4_ANISI
LRDATVRAFQEQELRPQPELVLRSTEVVDPHDYDDRNLDENHDRTKDYEQTDSNEVNI